MSRAAGFLDTICGDDEECMERVKNFLSYLDELERLVKKLPKPELLDYSPPLTERVKNLSQIREKAAEITRGDEDAVDYLVRRRIFIEHGARIQKNWTGDTCPVCGLHPTLILYKPSETGLFSGHRPYYRCVCGSEWRGWEWRCPRCGGEGRRNFETLIIASSIESRRCIGCKYVIPTLEHGLLELHKIHLLLTLLLP